jgi:hypothetical protein
MKTLKEELIDFKKWWNVKTINKHIFITDKKIDEYLESINFKPSEPEPIGKYEQKGEFICDSWHYFNGIKTCSYVDCINKECICGMNI